MSSVRINPNSADASSGQTFRDLVTRERERRDRRQQLQMEAIGSAHSPRSLSKAAPSRKHGELKGLAGLTYSQQVKVGCWRAAAEKGTVLDGKAAFAKDGHSSLAASPKAASPRAQPANNEPQADAAVPVSEVEMAASGTKEGPVGGSDGFEVVDYEDDFELVEEADEMEEEDYVEV